MTSTNAGAAPEASETEAAGGREVRHAPRQERSTKTLAKLEDAARHVLATVGRDRFTTNEVAQRAGVSIGTFYRYFDDRVQILDRIWPERRDEFLT